MTDQRRNTDPADDWIDGLLRDVSSVDPAPGADLMSRVLGDAATVTAASQAHHQPVADASLWDQLTRMLGGWPALGGLAAAGVAGLWIGIAPPAGIETFTADILGNTEGVSIFGSDLESLLGEAIDG